MPSSILFPTMIIISREAYVPQSDTYIAKDSAVNDEIDKLRLSATAALAERKDVIIVASVSCIYGIGSIGIVFDIGRGRYDHHRDGRVS